MPKTAHKTGHFLERWTTFLFFFKGYRLIVRNFTVGRGTGAGEIDLIFKHKNTLVFVEVKKRKTQTRAMESINALQQTRIVRASAIFLAKHPRFQSCQIRYDAVVYDNGLWPKHIQNAWRVL